jgi:hypothetical protein
MEVPVRIRIVLLALLSTFGVVLGLAAPAGATVIKPNPFPGRPGSVMVVLPVADAHLLIIEGIKRPTNTLTVKVDLFNGCIRSPKLVVSKVNAKTVRVYATAVGASRGMLCSHVMRTVTLSANVPQPTRVLVDRAGSPIRTSISIAMP